MAYPINYRDPYAVGPVDPRATAGPGYGYGGGRGNVGLLGNPFFNVGVGLLSQPQYSRYPRGPLEGVGKALAYAGETESAARRSAMENELFREKLTTSMMERQQQANLQKYFADHPELIKDQPLLGALLQFGGPDAVRGVATTLSDPTLSTRAAAAKVDLENATTTAGLNKGKLATEIADNAQLWENAAAAEDAAKYLASKPGGPALVSNDWATKAVRGGVSLAQLFGTDPATVMAAIPGLSGVDPKDIPHMLEAGETVLKARATVASLAESGSTNAGVVGLNNALTGQGAGAGVEVQQEKFRQARARAEQIAEASGWELPKPQPYGWRADEGAVGYQDGKVVPQRPSVYTPLPDEAQAVAPPTKVKATSIPVDAATGYPKFMHEPDVHRAIKAGVISVGDVIIYRGQKIRAVGPAQ